MRDKVGHYTKNLDDFYYVIACSIYYIMRQQKGESHLENRYFSIERYEDCSIKKAPKLTLGAMS